jgi:TolA-binding protein
MPKKRKAEAGDASSGGQEFKEFEQRLVRIAARIGMKHTQQIYDTALKLIKLKVPKEAVSICIDHIIELAWAELNEKSAPVTSTEQRIAELKEQLDYLNTLEDEGMRFRIQQEIQDLQDALKIENEWPDLISVESEGE